MQAVFNRSSTGVFTLSEIRWTNEMHTEWNSLVPFDLCTLVARIEIWRLSENGQSVHRIDDVMHPRLQEPILNLDKIPHARWTLRCIVCSSSEGACVQCAQKNCRTPFHVRRCTNRIVIRNEIRRASCRSLVALVRDISSIFNRRLRAMARVHHVRNLTPIV